jgi:predicted TIM-barrel fold metal-dependent hydrolase
MLRQGISAAVTLPVATRPEQVTSINAKLNTTDAALIPFGALHPFCDEYAAVIDDLQERGIRGVKLHPEFQGFYIDDPRCDGFFDALEESSLTVLVHAGYDPGPFSNDHCTPKKIARRLDVNPGLTLVAAHLGGLMMWDAVEKFLVGRKIWLDTAAIAGCIDTGQFLRICQAHGCDKILFGSDSPWFSQKEAVDFIQNSGLSQNEQTLIFSSNAQGLLA